MRRWQRLLSDYRQIKRWRYSEPTKYKECMALRGFSIQIIYRSWIHGCLSISLRSAQMYKYKALPASQNFLPNILFPSCVQNLRRCFVIIQIQILKVFLNAENSKSIVYSIRSVDHEPPLFVGFTLKSSINAPGAVLTQLVSQPVAIASAVCQPVNRAMSRSLFIVHARCAAFWY